MAVKFGKHIHGTKGMDCNNFEPLTFDQAAPSGQHFIFPSSLVYERIPAELMTYL